MQNRPFRAGPFALTTSITDLLSPGTITGGVNSSGAPYDKITIFIKNIYVVDKGGAGGSFTLYIDATGGSTAGKELAKDMPVAAGKFERLDFNNLPLCQGDFLTGKANANTTLSIVIVGEIAVGP